ncbi:MAG: hypothetical protein M1144_07090 [Candidatus Thermoplasmatota archaeon]|nr:hypothetical protein [Candidatus Thermoplasmatota archaeon]
MPTFKEKLESFAQKPIGYVSIVAMIIVLTALSLYFTGILFGAIIMIFLTFGIPIYIGWNKSFRTLLVVAIVVTAGVAPVWAALTNNQLFTPYTPLSSVDGNNSNSHILQDAGVTPFSGGPGSGGKYQFSITTVNQNVSYNATVSSGIHVTSVYLWVTNCAYDGFNATNGCGGNPDYFHLFGPEYLGNQTFSRARNVVTFDEKLPANQIMYYVFTANYSYNQSNLGYAWSCLGYCDIAQGIAAPVAQQSYYWNEGPITGSWAYIYAVKLLPSFYLLTAALGAILVVILFVYRWLKIREKSRMAQAAASAGGTSEEPEGKCDACGAEMRPGELFCWKCGKQMQPPKPKEAEPVPTEKDPASQSLK